MISLNKYFFICCFLLGQFTEDLNRLFAYFIIFNSFTRGQVNGDLSVIMAEVDLQCITVYKVIPHVFFILLLTTNTDFERHVM
jgi:hypothetical protein